MKKTVILIHGYLTDYQDFANLPKTLIKYYDYVVLLTLPGHGRFQDIKRFKVDNTIKTVEETVEFYLKKGTVDLIGYSMGGALSRYIASKYQTINKMVLLAPASKYLSPFLGINRIKYLLNKQNTTLSKKERRALLKEHDKAAYEFLKDRLLKKFSAGNGLTFCKLISTINQEKTAFETPTLIVYGKLDELVPLASVNYCLSKCISSLKEVMYLDDIGHLMLRTAQCQNIINKIEEFLTKEN